jgi:hypothetical protein
LLPPNLGATKQENEGDAALPKFHDSSNSGSNPDLHEVEEAPMQLPRPAIS